MATAIFALLLTACGGNNRHGESAVPDNVSSLQGTAHVYRKDSPYSKVLVSCINPNGQNDHCKLSALSFVGQENPNVTKEMIMNRLVVSHDWMGERFSKLLDRYKDKHLLHLFGSVTAVVIHKDINPSFYTPETGAIYLDPRYIWLTPVEASTITDKDDFRSNYGNDLQFIAGSIYTKDGYNISHYEELDSGKTRSIDDIAMNFIALLYHELAHANDFVPPSQMSTIGKNQTPLAAANSLEDTQISTYLYNESPLTSKVLDSLGKVLYQGEKASEYEKTMTGHDAGLLFDEDYASDIYAYSSQYEDTATLFADTMMKIHYDVDNTVLFLNADAYYDRNKIDIEWGISNPIAKPGVSSRALLVSNRLNPIKGGWDASFTKLVGTAKYIGAENNQKKFNAADIQIKSINDFKKFFIQR